MHKDHITYFYLLMYEYSKHIHFPLLNIINIITINNTTSYLQGRLLSAIYLFTVCFQRARILTLYLFRTFYDS